MKIMLLLLALLAAFCFACKDRFVQREFLAERQQLLAGAAVQEALTQPRIIATM